MKILAVFVFLLAQPSALFGGQLATYFFKIVTQNEDPIVNITMFWKDDEELDWRPTKSYGFGERGSDGNGEKFYTVQEMASRPEDITNAQVRHAAANYQVFLVCRRQGGSGTLKITASGYQPIVVRATPVDNQIFWQRIQMSREPDILVRHEGRQHRETDAVREHERRVQPQPPIANTQHSEKPTRVAVEFMDSGTQRQLPGATVTFTNLETGETHRTITNQNGYAEVMFRTVGRIQIVATKNGYATKTLNDTVRKNQDTRSSDYMHRNGAK